MSWIAGCKIYDSCKNIEKEAREDITLTVRHAADLEEFPNMKSELPIVFVTKKIFDSFEDAEEYSNEIYKDWGRKKNIILEFKEKFKDTAKTKDIKRQIDETENKKANYYEVHKPKYFKSNFVTCPNCGSKINKEFIFGYKCPVCYKEIMSKTTKDTIENYNSKLKLLNTKLKEEYKKQKRKTKFAVFYEEYVG